MLGLVTQEARDAQAAALVMKGRRSGAEQHHADRDAELGASQAERSAVHGHHASPAPELLSEHAAEAGARANEEMLGRYGAQTGKAARGREGLMAGEMLPPRPISPSEYRRPALTDGHAALSHQYQYPDHGHVPGPLVNAPVEGYPPLPARTHPAAVRDLGNPIGMSGDGPIVNTLLAGGGRALQRPVGRPAS